MAISSSKDSLDTVVQQRPGSVLMGAAIVCAAAGYAALALRFRSVSASGIHQASGSAETKAANSASRTFLRREGNHTAHAGASTTEEFQRAQREYDWEHVGKSTTGEFQRAQHEYNWEELRRNKMQLLKLEKLRWAAHTLGLAPSVTGLTQQRLKEAYRAKALKYHPDRSSDAKAAERFQQISKAYDVLTEELCSSR
mmetsp:Transcript_26737/g.58700  ORF Transcript_26737/g.58700 Transcript_26737/m.58700 type:complete len:197 (-) Transcript_26737:178-768(-)|eukprot:6201777-Pleurochrysis_carterae.AAC.2